MNETVNSAFTTALKQVGYAKELTIQVSEHLRRQRAIMRQGGMDLPSPILRSLADVQSEFEQLERDLTEQQTELEQLRALADMSAKITTSLEATTILREAMDIIITLTKAERGYLIAKNEITGELEFLISRDTAVNSTSEPPQVSRSILNKVLETSEPLLTDNADEDQRLEGNNSITMLNLRSVLCAPLEYKGKILGLVYVDNRVQSGVFTGRERNLLTAFANTVAVALSNANLYASIQTTLLEITRVKELMDNVFASIGSGVIVIDVRNRITTFNHAAETILERRSETVIGQQLSEVFPGPILPLLDHLDATRISGERQILAAELETPERGQIRVNMKLNPLKDNRGTTRGIAIVLDDITEQIRREEQLRAIKHYLPPEMVDNIHAISQLELGGERREVTCAFITVIPLQFLPMNSPPKTLMEIVNHCHDVATEYIHDGGGIIDKYMGTEIMVLFNTQLNPLEDHACKAVETALNIRAGISDLYTEKTTENLPFLCKVGIHTGIATLGNLGSLNRREFSAIGDTINLAKRIEQAAKTGQILISENTYQHLLRTSGDRSQNFRFEKIAPIQPKGRQQKTNIYEALPV